MLGLLASLTFSGHIASKPLGKKRFLRFEKGPVKVASKRQDDADALLLKVLGYIRQSVINILPLLSVELLLMQKGIVISLLGHLHGLSQDARVEEQAILSVQAVG
jgi:hypothetical protein